MIQTLKILSVLSILAFSVLCPFVVSKFDTYMITEAMIFAIFGVSFYLLLGHTGLLSFGHAAYFGLGAYSTALCLVHFPQLPLLLTLLLGAASGCVMGLLIGSMLLRLTKIYFSFATLAFSQMLWAIAWKWRSLTGGDDGLTGWSGRVVDFSFLGQFGMSNVVFMYYLVFFTAVICIALCWYFTQTPLGQTLASIRINSHRVRFLGVNINLAKFMLFGFAGLIAGTSGSLFILFKKMASPSFFDMMMSFHVVLISVIGGYTTFLGPIVGSFIYVYITEYLSSFTKNWQAIMGAFFVVLIIFFPGGVMGAFRQLRGRLTIMGKGGSK